MRITRKVQYWALLAQGQGHSATSKFFYIYYNTNCQVPLLNLGTSWEVYIKHVCSSDTNIQNL